MPILLALLAKLTLILVAGLVVSASWRTATPSLRHLVLAATLTCGLTLPAAMLLSPRWNVAILPGTLARLSASEPILATHRTQPAPSIRGGDQRSVPVATPSPIAASSPSAAGNAQSIASAGGDLTASIILFLWTFGFVVIITWLVAGRIRLRRIAHEGWPLTEAHWQEILTRLRQEAGVTRDVRLLSSPIVSTPITWGSFAPVIVLPEDALDWADDHRQIVLRHELAHIARQDSLTQLMAGFVCAIYWFHPLVWIAERRLRAECERACDDMVLSLGTPAAEYASHLLEVARSARAFGAPGFLSVAMARPSQLEGRMLAVLNESHRRVPASRGAMRAAAVLSAILLLALAAFQPIPRAAASTAPRMARVYRPTLVEYGPKLVVPADLRRSEAFSKPKSTDLVKADENPADTTFQQSAPARDGGTLDLDLKTGGDVTITTWDRAEVSVRASLGGRSWRETRVTLTPSAGDVTLVSDFIGSPKNPSTSHNFYIQVPRNFSVRIKSTGGGVSLNNIAGRFSGSTGGGEITIRNANGDVNLSTGGGEVDVSDSNLNGRVTTGGGVIKIQSVNGNLIGESGGGPVIYSNSTSSGTVSSISSSAGGRTTTAFIQDSAGKRTDIGSSAINMTSAGGPLSLNSAPRGARVSTGGGRIFIGPSGGEIYAQTGGGRIDVGPATGSVTAVTGAGDVNIELQGPGSHSVSITSGKGEVVITAPADLNATLDLETAYTDNYRGKTRIISDWPVSVTETNTWDDREGTPRKYVRVRQNIGRGGGVLRVRTVNGNIVLKKSR